MRVRNIIFIVLVAIEIVLILFLAIKKSNHNRKGYLCLGLSVILTVGTVWMMLFPPYKDINPDGQYQVAYQRENLIDESRLESFKNDGSKREIEIGTWYPKDKDNSEKSTLIIFSHGSFGNINNNKTLCVELASRGYVVVSISHTYHAFETTLSDGSKAKISSEYFNEIMKDQPQKDAKTSFARFQKWMDLRTKDISFVIDTIIARSEEDPLYKRVDKNKIVTMGHSMGGNAALGMPRLRNDISASIALESAFMCDIVGVKDNDFIFTDEEYPVPCLNIYSDSSYSNLGKWKQYRVNYNMLNSDNPKYVSKHMEGIGHMHLCDFSLQSPFLSWVLSGTDSNTSAYTNLKNINNYVIEFLKDNNL